MTPQTDQVTPTMTSAATDDDSLGQRCDAGEVPSAQLCVTLARDAARRDDMQACYRWIGRVADHESPYVAWVAAATLMSRVEKRALPQVRRSARVALAGSYTTSQLGALLRVAALRRGVHVVVHELDFNTYAQEILDPDSGLYAFDPDYVLIAPHDGAIAFPQLVEDPERALAEEAVRWQRLWEAVRAHSRARVIQHNIAVRPDCVWGHAAARTPGAREPLVAALNARLARVAEDDVLWVDCDRIAATFGKGRWFDDRYWHLSRQAVALDALAPLARHTAAVLAGAEGLSSKCVVVDLDNTLWGGVIAEDGLGGIQLGGSPRGEAHLALQEHLLALRARGIALAVVSKNDDADAREPFRHHPDMRLAQSDFAAFVANWTDKATNLRHVARELGIGVEALVFVDDDPVERETVRRLLPEAEVIALPGDPAGYVGALSQSLLFEEAVVTDDDLARAERYRARADAKALRERAPSLPDFLHGLRMRASVGPVQERDLSRVVQLIAKTNQFNLTSRRHGLADVRAFMDDANVTTLALRLSDRFGDHGLVALMIAGQDDTVLDIDTWLMSCRVIGRTLEETMLAQACELALARGCDRLRGTFVATSRNDVVRGLFARLGFVAEGVDEAGHATWTYDIDEHGIPASEYITTTASDVRVHA